MSVKMRSITQQITEKLKGGDMAASSGSVYDVIEVIGTSTESWEKAAVVAVETAAKTLRDLRIAEVVEMDLQIDDGKVRAFRTKVKLSFKYESKV
jgi:flavin-binding protein dodecin